jgi:hypothetical protein
MIRPVVLLDGRVVGTWALTRSKGRVTVTPFTRITAAVRAGVEAEVADIGRFLGAELEVAVEQ